MNKDKKPLSETHPELAKEADGWDPKSISSGSGIKKNWICKKGHKWSAVVGMRARGSSCPYCSGRRAVIGENDLGTTHPGLINQLIDPQNSELSAGSQRKVEWTCDAKHVWTATPYARIYLKADCPYCSGRKVIVGRNDLVTTHPDLAKGMVDADPTHFSMGSDKKVNWKCELGHVWKTSISHRVNGTECPYCKGNKVLSGFNDLKSTNPVLAKEADGWDPAKTAPMSHKKRKWKCVNNHTFFATVASRNLNKTGCPFCSGRNPVKGINDLGTINPTLAKEAVGWDPSNFLPGSRMKVDWKCTRGHNWKARIANRGKHNQGCPYCGNKKILKGYNDLATTHPEIAKQAYNFDPSSIIGGNNRLHTWKCELGHIYKTSPHKKTSQNANCPYCSGHQVLKGFNDVKTKFPELVSEIFGWDPEKYSWGSGVKVWWICIHGHKWKTTISSRTSGNKTSCPTCSTSGFDPNENGFLYFLIQPIWEIYQIGITNNPEKRLKQHRKNGFETIELRGPMDGHTAQELETLILRCLKSNNAELSPEHIAGKFDGYSESWTIDSYKVNNLKELIDKASEAGF